MKIPCHVKDGRPNNAKKLNEAFRAFDGKDVIVTIEKSKSKRSEQSNKYYWACVIMDEIACIKENWGEIWSKDDMHAFNKIYFFGEEKVIEATGEIIKVPKSSVTTQYSLFRKWSRWTNKKYLIPKKNRLVTKN